MARPNIAKYQGVLRSAIESKKLGAVGHSAEALYFRLLLVSDGTGRFYGSPVDVGLRANPRRYRAGEIDNDSVARDMAELEREGLIRSYEVDGDLYLELTDYWQPASKGRERESEFPAPLRPRSVSTVGTDCPQAGDMEGTTISEPVPSVGTDCPAETGDRKQESESETDARGRAPEPSHTHTDVSGGEFLERVAAVAADFPELDQRPAVCEAMLNWLRTQHESHRSQSPPGTQQLRTWFGLVAEYPPEVAVATLEDAAGGAWRALRREQFEERRGRASALIHAESSRVSRRGPRRVSA